MQKEKPQKPIRGGANTNELVTFRFFNITLDNVPFCHKTLSLKLHYRLTSFPTDPTPVEDFQVKWTKVIEIQRTISLDSNQKPVPTYLDVTVYTHSRKGSGKEEIAHGKMDLLMLVKSGKTSETLPLSSNILESVLHFDVEMIGGEAFVEAPPDTKADDCPPLPEIHPIIKNSWFNFKHNPDLIEADANTLVEAAMKPIPKIAIKA